MTIPPKIFNPSEMEFIPRKEYGDQAQLAPVSSHEIGTELGTGYVRLKGAEIPWTIKYDEVIVVLEGEFTVRTSDGELSVSQHQSIWLPKGTELTYVSENALLFYAIHPSDWASEE